MSDDDDSDVSWSNVSETDQYLFSMLSNPSLIDVSRLPRPTPRSKFNESRIEEVLPGIDEEREMAQYSVEAPRWMPPLSFDSTSRPHSPDVVMQTTTGTVGAPASSDVPNVRAHHDHEHDHGHGHGHGHETPRRSELSSAAECTSGDRHEGRSGSSHKDDNEHDRAGPFSTSTPLPPSHTFASAPSEVGGGGGGGGGTERPEDSRDDGPPHHNNNGRTSKSRASELEDDEMSKRAILLDLRQLAMHPEVQLTKEWTMDDRMDDMLLELQRHTLLLHEKEGITTLRDGLHIAVLTIENVNKQFGFLDLEGWSSSVLRNANKYDSNLGRIYRKWWKRGHSTSPEMDMVIAIFGSMAMHHLQRSMSREMMRAAQKTHFSSKSKKATTARTKYDESSSDDEAPPPAVAPPSSSSSSQAQRHSRKK